MPIRTPYAIAAAIVFAIEVLIAVFVHDGFVRPYLGDVLAVVLVYLALRAATPLPVLPAVIVTLGVATAIEFAQLFHMLDALGLGHNRLARVVLGGVFDVKDLGCYTVGAMAVLVAENLRQRWRPIAAPAR